MYKESKARERRKERETVCYKVSLTLFRDERFVRNHASLRLCMLNLMESLKAVGNPRSLGILRRLNKEKIRVTLIKLIE